MCNLHGITVLYTSLRIGNGVGSGDGGRYCDAACGSAGRPLVAAGPAGTKRSLLTGLNGHIIAGIDTFHDGELIPDFSSAPNEFGIETIVIYFEIEHATIV